MSLSLSLVSVFSFLLQGVFRSGGFVDLFDSSPSLPLRIKLTSLLVASLIFLIVMGVEVVREFFHSFNGFFRLFSNVLEFSSVQKIRGEGFVPQFSVPGILSDNSQSNGTNLWPEPRERFPNTLKFEIIFFSFESVIIKSFTDLPFESSCKNL